jgi:DNA-binding NtrC family response regulator
LRFLNFPELSRTEVIMAELAIVIIDPEREQRLGANLKSILQKEDVYRVDVLDSLRKFGEAAVGSSPRLFIVIISSRMDDSQGLLVEIRATYPRTPLLLVLTSEMWTDVVDDLSSSSEDFLVTPLRPAEVRFRVRRLIPSSFSQYSPGARDRISQACGLAQLVGEAPPFQALKNKIALVARFECPVLLAGETGTGKERCARALHYLSGRANKPFLPVNCGAVPVDLFESELYGHQKGAFTGAVKTHPGLIGEAHGGTLFLDEIETLGLASQVKLLRFLQDQTYYALGSAKPRQADVWIIASANVDLLKKAREGTFREDLFYRLAVITLAVPPLRERPGDIPLLATHFLRLHGQRHGKDKKQFSTRAIQLLSEYAWPGNVRELENVIQQIIVFSESETIEREDVPISTGTRSVAGGCNSFKQRKAEAVDQFQRKYLNDMLKAYHGNVTHAARAANMDRRAFGRLIKKYRTPPTS